MNAWIDFKELRSRLDFERVLQHYGVEVRRKGDQHHGYCPLPNHRGVRNSPSFSANLTRGIFKCFGCQTQGNLLDFAVLMTGRNPEDPTDVRSVAIELHERFIGRVPSASREGTRTEAQPAPTSKTETDTRPRVINAPLDFELKGLDATHPYLRNRGFTSDTIAHFGLGYCSRGYLKERIAIPLHLATGRLIGYAGRVVDDNLISEDNPKYRFPGKRERKGVRYEFQKSRFVYNGHRIQKPVDDLVVVEGFASVWWLWQCGIKSTVAVMGSYCVSGQSKPARDGRMKTSHFESGIAHRAAKAAEVRDEPTQRESATNHCYFGLPWLVAASDRPPAGH